MKTSYSRHELYALGEPLGDGATRKEVGRVIYGGGGGGPTYTESKVTNSNIPEYAQPYVENMLGAAQKQVYQADGTTFQPYKAYGGTYAGAGGIDPTTGKAAGVNPKTGLAYQEGDQLSYDPSKGIAGFQPMQTQAQQGIQSMRLPGQFDTAMTGTQNAANSLFNTAGQAGGYGAQGMQSGMQGQGLGMQGGQYYGSQGMQSGMQGQGLGMQGGQYYGSQGEGYGAQAANAGNQYAQQATDPNAVQSYMSPYMQNVVDVQKREAGRQSAIQGTQQQAQATQAGAFGGGRDAIMRAERERNLGQQMNDIQAQGSQNAFQNAQQAQQFGANLGLQGKQAGMQGAQVGLQGVQAGLQGTAQGMQGAQTGLQGVQAGLQGTAQGMQGAQTGLQGVNAQQAGYSQAMQGANQLSNIANQQLQAQQGIYGLQNQYGAQQQALEQSKLNQAQQDYANTQQYPMMQLGSLSNMLRGLPMQSSSTNMYQAQPNALTQGIGAAGTAASLYNAYNNPSAPKTMAAGGITSIPRYDVGGQVMSQLEQMDDRALENEAKTSPSPRIREMAQAILKQRQAGMDTAPQMDMAPPLQQDMGMAGGGIIAFAGGEKVPSPYAEDENLPLEERMANTRNRIRSRTDPTFVSSNAAAPNNTAAVLNENEFPPAGITSAAPKAVSLSPRAAEFAAARNFKAPTKTGGKLISEDEFFANKPVSSAETSYTGTKLTPESLEKLEAQAADNKRGYADMLQAYYKKFPKAAAPAVDPKSIMAADPTADKAAMAATQVDPFASAKDALAKAQIEAGKTRKELYDEDLEAKKALGLDQNEAQQAYMKKIMGQQSNIAADAEQKKYLRLAEFFSSWGSTPGDTLVAGMQAVKAKIPDMIADIKEQRKAEAEADKVLYELGQAQRQEKLGNWDKVELRKTKAAEIAAKLQESITTATASVEHAKLTSAATIKASENQARAHVEGVGMQGANALATTDLHGQYQVEVANINDRTRKAHEKGLIDKIQSDILYRMSHDLSVLNTTLQKTKENPVGPYAQAEKLLSVMPDIKDASDEQKTIIKGAIKTINKINWDHEKELSREWERIDTLAQKYGSPAGKNPYNSPVPAPTPKIIDPFAKSK